MSSYYSEAYHPLRKQMERAFFLDDYFGRHRYGVRFDSDGENGRVWRMQEIIPPEISVPPEETMTEDERAADLAAIHAAAAADMDAADWIAMQHHIHTLTAALREAEKALAGMVRAYFDFHDAQSRTEPVTGRAENAYEDAQSALATIRAALEQDEPTAPSS